MRSREFGRVDQAMLVFVVPGMEIWITTPQVHWQVLVLFRAAIPPMFTVGEPGAQGVGVTGTHGIGVRTPSAAAVAAATVGLEGELHMPNGAMFTIGI